MPRFEEAARIQSLMSNRDGESATGSEASSSSVSVTSPSQLGRDAGEIPDIALAELSNEFQNWTYKNVELLGERNREMAEQAAELRSESSSKDGTLALAHSAENAPK